MDPVRGETGILHFLPFRINSVPAKTSILALKQIRMITVRITVSH